MTEQKTKGIGIYAGFKPNRISFYLLLLQTGRIDELEDTMFKDMEEYRIEAGKRFSMEDSDEGDD